MNLKSIKTFIVSVRMCERYMCPKWLVFVVWRKYELRIYHTWNLLQFTNATIDSSNNLLSIYVFAIKSEVNYSKAIMLPPSQRNIVDY